MLYLILSSLIMLALLDRALRGGRIRLLKLDLEFKLFALRDELRNAAIIEEIPYNSLFDYMDTTLTRTIGTIDKVNPWLAVGLICIHRNNPTLYVAYRQLKEALSQTRNHKIADVYQRYLDCLAQFLKSRYKLSWPLAAIIFGMVSKEKRQHDSIEQEERELAPIFSIAPETSTLSEYSRATAPAPREAHATIVE